METLLWKGLAMISLIVSFVALIMGIVAVDKITILYSTSSVSSSGGQKYPSSCQNIKGKSTLYMIQPDINSPAYLAYCDTNSDGGGWTLVASIHENNIDGKCTPGDKWSSEQGTSKGRSARNWENKNTFGKLETITEDDYKNSAYYAVKAKDIMLWHVPNGNKFYQISNAAYLKYHTANNVLEDDSLQNLFANKFPIRTIAGGLDGLIETIQNTSVTSDIPFWYNYQYDGDTRTKGIFDGGNDMYDNGNVISFRTDRENFTEMVYNTPYFLYGSGVEVKSGANGYPFVTLAWVGSGLGSAQVDVEYFQYRVKSNFGADGRGTYVVFNNTDVSYKQMTAQYTAFMIANASDPSVCEVYFYIKNSKWNSKAPTSMRRIGWAKQTRDATNMVRFTGQPSNVLLGYTLLSKTRGRAVLQSEIEAMLMKYMKYAENFSFKVTILRKVAPVKFLKGSTQDVLNGIPTSHRDNVQAGYIQFRAFNSVGLPNAICPGIKTSSDNPEQMCLGGSSTSQLDISQCGDYAGWNGSPGDPGSDTAPSKTGKSKRDINSSILIFVR